MRMSIKFPLRVIWEALQVFWSTCFSLFDTLVPNQLLQHTTQNPTKIGKGYIFTYIIYEKVYILKSTLNENMKIIKIYIYYKKKIKWKGWGYRSRTPSPLINFKSTWGQIPYKISQAMI